MSTLDNPNVAPVNASPQQTILRYGVIGGLVLVVYSLLNFVLGLSKPSAGTFVGLLNFAVILAIYIFMMIYAVRDHRDNNQGGFITFGKAFMVAFFTSVLAAIINTIFVFLYMNIIDPGYMAEILSASEDYYESMGMPENQIEVSLQWAEWMMGPTGQGILFGVGTVFGAIVALIVASTMKKNPPEFE